MNDSVPSPHHASSSSSSSDLRITVIIPAAGKGERYSASGGGGSGQRDKLAEDLGGRAMLLRTVELFNKRTEVIETIVAAPADTLDAFKFKFGDQLAFHGVKIAAGGRIDRWETVRNALAEVSEKATHVAIHDAARPAASEELINRVFEAALKLDAVIPVVRMTSTIKRLDREATVDAANIDPIAARLLGMDSLRKNEARTVKETLDRRDLVEVQTPQVFRKSLLQRAYAQKDLAGATDDASVVERLNDPEARVFAVEGDPRNIKVTTIADLHLVRAIMGVRAPEERAVHKRF